MRLPKRFWLVTDATETSTIEDVLTETGLGGLLNMGRGGLLADRHPAIFTDEVEARCEAYRRLGAAGSLVMAAIWRGLELEPADNIPYIEQETPSTVIVRDSAGDHWRITVTKMERPE